MAEFKPIPLIRMPISSAHAQFKTISSWPFDDPFVTRLLQNDIPQRVTFGNCRIWIYHDPNGQVVGFGTLDECNDYANYTNGQTHPYIPLLAVNPTIKSLGYGTSILQHLTDEATLLACRPGCHDVLFLDVYTASEKAIKLYTTSGFASITPDPIPDPQEGGKPYIVMAKRVTIASA